MTRDSKHTTVKIGPEIDAKLYRELVRVAKENGQSQRELLEKAIAHYIRFVVPSMRPGVMTQFQRSTDKNRELHKLLAR